MHAWINQRCHERMTVGKDCRVDDGAMGEKAGTRALCQVLGKLRGEDASAKGHQQKRRRSPVAFRASNPATSTVIRVSQHCHQMR